MGVSGYRCCPRAVAGETQAPLPRLVLTRGQATSLQPGVSIRRYPVCPGTGDQISEAGARKPKLKPIYKCGKMSWEKLQSPKHLSSLHLQLLAGTSALLAALAAMPGSRVRATIRGETFQSRV